jgi:hypothetical protein
MTLPFLFSFIFSRSQSHVSRKSYEKRISLHLTRDLLHEGQPYRRLTNLLLAKSVSYVTKQTKLN